MNLLLLREAFRRTNQDILRSEGFKFLREALLLLSFAAFMLTIIVTTAYVVGIVIFNSPVTYSAAIVVGSLFYPMIFFNYVRPFYKNLKQLKEDDRLTKQRIKEGIK